MQFMDGYLKYRVSIKSFPDYKHLLQENYMEYKHIVLPLFKLVSTIFFMFLLLCYVKIWRKELTDAFSTIIEDMLENTWIEIDYRLDVLRATKKRILKCTDVSLKTC
jgi:hypothetical protein